MKAFQKLSVGLLFAALLAACGTPAIKDEGHSGEGAATHAVEGVHTAEPHAAGTSSATHAVEGVATRAANDSSVGVLAPPTATPTGAPTVTTALVKGSATYRERITLPASATVVVQLQDVSRADAPATVLSEVTLKPEGKAPPYAFELPYDPAKIDATHRYAVSVRILDGVKLLFLNTTMSAVVTMGAPSDVGEVILNRVG